MRLAPCDFDLLQKAILELYDYRDAQEFRAAAPSIMLRVIPADGFVLMDADMDVPTRGAKIIDVWDPSGCVAVRGAVASMERAGWKHPFTQHVVKTGDPSALKFSDFFTDRQFRNSGLYAELYRPLQIERMMGALILRGPTSVTTINAMRRIGAREFSERDRLMLNLLRPHFDLARRNAGRVSARRASKARELDVFALTPREREVGVWMARGKTNLEISLILRTRVRTVEKHVEKILAKLGVENRTAAALIIARADGE